MCVCVFYILLSYISFIEHTVYKLFTWIKNHKKNINIKNHKRIAIRNLITFFEGYKEWWKFYLLTRFKQVLSASWLSKREEHMRELRDSHSIRLERESPLVRVRVRCPLTCVNVISISEEFKDEAIPISSL